MGTELLTINEVKQWLHLNRVTIYRLIAFERCHTMSPENGDRDPVFGSSPGSAAALPSLESGRDGSSRGVFRIIHRF